VVTIWEAEIKRNLGKLRSPPDLLDRVRQAPFDELSITAEHGIAAGRLPLHHRDPFDRMLVAQAQLEELVLVTGDELLGRYDVSIFRATAGL
jgi:PIN domain nuclease of toxin-antitoxin system